MAADDENRVIIYAMPQYQQFYVEFGTALFTAAIALAFDIGKSDISAAGVARFKGETGAALQWIEFILGKLDEMLDAARG